MTTLTEQEKIRKYDEMVEKRRGYSKKHYNKMKELAALGKKYQEELKKK